MIFQQKVNIDNPRLSFFYYVILIAVLATHALHIVTLKAWTAQIPLFVTSVPTFLPEDSLNAIQWSDWEDATACTDAASITARTIYDSDRYHLSASSCIEPCRSPLSYDAFLGKCKDILDLVDTRQGTDISISSISKKYAVQENNNHKVEIMFAPWLLHAMIQVDYTFEPREDPKWFFELDQKLHAQTNKDATTVVIDSSGKHKSTIAADSFIRFNVSEILELSGGTLDFGSLISVVVKCYNDNADIALEILTLTEELPTLPGIHASNVQPVCLLRFAADSNSLHGIGTKWSHETVWDNDENDYVKAYTSTATDYVRIRSKQSTGKMRAADTMQILLIVISFLVIFTLPEIICTYFVLIFLGPLSAAYHKALRPEYTIVESSVNYCLESLQRVLVFEALEDGLQGGITRRTIRLALEKVFANKDDVLDAEELSNLAVITMKMVHEKKGYETNQPITLEEYTSALAGGQSVTIGDIAKLFDVQRPRSLMEKLFTPTRLKKALKLNQAASTLARESLNEEVFGNARGVISSEQAEALRDEKLSHGGQDAILKNKVDQLEEKELRLEAIEYSLERQLSEIQMAGKSGSIAELPKSVAAVQPAQLALPNAKEQSSLGSRLLELEERVRQQVLRCEMFVEQANELCAGAGNSLELVQMAVGQPKTDPLVLAKIQQLSEQMWTLQQSFSDEITRLAERQDALQASAFARIQSPPTMPMTLTTPKSRGS
mmetsp:Transcript_17707/g.30972  ORF Transcript_17707/g.30972 Transcript_17707/m.30972 type:complete len:722 (+) Transcript_17707:128-2293(+)